MIRREKLTGDAHAYDGAGDDGAGGEVGLGFMLQLNRRRVLLLGTVFGIRLQQRPGLHRQVAAHVVRVRAMMLQ
jgi:hypothetical protein